MFDSAITEKQSAQTTPAEALELMRKDISAHNEQKAQKSYLGYAVSTITNLGGSDSLSPVEQMNRDLQEAIKKGDTSGAEKLASQARALVEADQSSMRTDQLVTQYGSGMVKTAGLFIPGKVGYAVSGLTYALDQAKPGDSISNQLLDGGLGLTKGLALKGTFNVLGGAELGIATKAVSMGVSSRLIDAGLTRQTYAEGDGYSAVAGLTRIGEQSFNRTALASDVITFGLAHGAVRQINSITGGALSASPFWSVATTGGVFGVATGSVQEINRQQQAGEKFDLSKVLTSAALTGVTDMIAAAPGAKMTSMRATPIENRGAAERTTTPDDTRLPSPIQRNFAGSTAREFQLVDGSQQVIDQLRNSPDKFVLTPVREVLESGKLGTERNLLIQHVEQGQDGSAKLPAANSIYGLADLIATCNPKLLPEGLQTKHIIPSAESLYLTQSTEGRLRFSDTFPVELKPGESQPVKLGNTVSEVLMGPQVPDYLDYTHDRSAMAEALSRFKTPVRYFNGGADNIAFELPDRSILKVTDHPWDPSWGKRNIWTMHGRRVIDAPILQAPMTIETKDVAVTYFIQKRLQSPVTTRDLRVFDSMLDQDGTYKFWDNDFKDHGKSQLGFDPDTRRLYIIDYDSVRLPHLVPDYKVDGSSSPSSMMSRYLRLYEH